MKTVLIIGWMGLLLLPACLVAREEASYRPLSATIIDSLQQIDELQYGREPQQDSDLAANRKAPVFSPTTLRWIIYGVLGVVLLGIALALIRRFFESEGQAIASAHPVVPGSVEELTSANYLQQMNMAAQAQHWAGALRYSHLWVLQQLQQRGHIQWEPHKTDTDYRFELKDPRLRQAFSRSANSFAKAWYAEYPVAEVDFAALEEVRAAFSSKIGSSSTQQVAQP